MQRKYILPVLMLSMSLSAAPLFAQSHLQNFAHDLLQQGYTKVTISHTFLGRGRITAQKGKTSREVIMSRSGHILQDETQPAPETTASGMTQDNPETDRKNTRNGEDNSIETGPNNGGDGNDSGHGSEGGSGNGGGGEGDSGGGEGDD